MKRVNVICKNTEQLGILVERAMCDIVNIPFNTKRKYDALSDEITNDINETVGPMLKRMKLDHVGNLNKTYDFIDNNDLLKPKTVSVKTIMSGNKICPQNIGQCSLNRLNTKLQLDIKTKAEMKGYFLDNKKDMLQKYLVNCFCCDMTIVYKFDKGCVYVINKQKDEINIRFDDALCFSTSKTLSEWNESNTIYVENNAGGNVNNLNAARLSLGEFQIHNNRDCIKFRFNIETLVSMINNNYVSNLCVNVYNLKTRYNFTVEKNNKMKSKLCFPSFNYIGSKMKLLDYITETIYDYTGKKSYSEISGFADICSGTGVVAFNALRGGCKSILTNDIQHYAYTVSSVWCTKNINIEKIRGLVAALNLKVSDIKESDLPDTNPNTNTNANTNANANENDKFFVYSNYTQAGHDKRMYLTKLNGYKTDILRQNIEDFKIEKNITDEEYRLLLKLLLYAVSNVSNIASVYGAYLKAYKKSALKDLVLNVELVDSLVVFDDKNDMKHVSYNLGIVDLLSDINLNNLSGYEVVYLDPPYVANRSYHDNYHVLETISRYDYPKLKGKTGLREIVDTKSKFCSKRDAYGEFEETLRSVKSKYIFISYSSESVISKDDLIEMMEKSGWHNVKCYEKVYQRFKSNKNSNDKQPKQVKEYIFCGSQMNN
jgi:adenine-specific DNA-methyltransferase